MSSTQPLGRTRTPQEPSGQRRLEFGPTAGREALKRQNRAGRMLEALKCGPQTTWELMQLGGAGFSSRLRELRNEGHRIECEQHEDFAVYRLVPRG